MGGWGDLGPWRGGCCGLLEEPAGGLGVESHSAPGLQQMHGGRSLMEGQAGG